MEFEFGYNEDKNREFLPDYGGIDWHQRWLDEHDGEDEWSVWGETFDHMGEFCEQLNQSNCAVFINDTDSDFDCIIVSDHRDESADFWWCRYDIGDEKFTEIVDDIHEEVSCIFTKYPTEQCVEYVLGLMGLDLDKGIPDDWR